jgi:hypothetical protein
MSIIPATYHCDADGCNKEYAKDTNHWLTLVVKKNVGATLEVWKGATDGPTGLTIAHACGYDHATQLFAQWMATGTVGKSKGDAGADHRS